MTTPTPWYTIRASAAKPQAAGAAPQAAAEVLIYGDIGESWWSESVSAASFVRELAALDVTHITVRINSLGGSVPDGIAIYNAIKRHPAHVTTVVDAMAMSVASLIAIAGDEVQMAENAVLMIHAPWTWADGNAAKLRELADMLDTWASAMATSYAARTGQPVDQVLSLVTDGADHYYTAAEALGAGFVDTVITALPVAAMARPDSAHAQRLPQAIAQRLGLPVQASAPITNPAASPHIQENVSMTTPAQAAASAGAATETQLAEARAAGIRAEADRRTGILAVFQPLAGREGMAEVQAACLADPTITDDMARERILARMGQGLTSIAGSHMVTVEDEADKFRDAATQSILARAGVQGADGKPVRADTANPLRGHTLRDLAQASLQRRGINTNGMDKLAVVAAAFTQSTSDFPIVLENVMHKTLQAAYATAPDTHSRFCARGSVSDFRAHNRYRLGSLGNLDAKTELGEFRSKSLPDAERATISIGTKGNLVNISRESVINDDLGAFTGITTMMGRSAKRTVEADVYAFLVSNPVLSDGLPLFHASRGNLAAAGALPTVQVLDALRVAMAQQRDVSGNDFLDLRPAIVVAPMSLGSTLRVLNDSQYDPDVANKLTRPNVVRGLFSDVVDTPRLPGTAWFAFASPADAPVIEVAYLDGNDTPYLEMTNAWNTDGSAWKIRLDYGIAAIDYRGAYMNPGA